MAGLRRELRLMCEAGGESSFDLVRGGLRHDDDGVVVMACGWRGFC